ncbi:MAG TPA: sigma-54 dependent transcriptional regulator [Bryobacteraceae bacterium]|nr:sigma-54 dependent transcriptional regulator [Bryobacteraceae bacterium]
MSVNCPVHGLVGESPQIASIRRLINKAAGNRLPVLLLGESGTGKEVVARAIYAANPQGQFVPIDCGTLVGTLLESELFGHVKGSFSGAVDNKKGLLELADEGVAFFDEIGDLPLEIQVKLLRVVQEHEFRPVGALKWHKVEPRIIAATHRDLKAEVAAGRFRQDLYYRLNVFTMHLPPLRDHKGDIPALCEHFLADGPRQGLPRFQPSPELMRILTAYDWPGNVRELQHVLERIAVLSSEGALDLADLPTQLQNYRAAENLRHLAAEAGPGSYPQFTRTAITPVISIRDAERTTITRALTETGGERARTADLLGISRTTLYRKMKEYGIQWGSGSTRLTA